MVIYDTDISQCKLYLFLNDKYCDYMIYLQYNTTEFNILPFVHLSSEAHLHVSAVQMQRYYSAILCAKNLLKALHSTCNCLERGSNPYCPRYRPSSNQ